MIDRSLQQYVSRFNEFDAVTVNPYMGSCSINTVKKAGLGCYVLAYTSNESRADIQKQRILDDDIIGEYIMLWEKARANTDTPSQIDEFLRVVSAEGMVSTRSVHDLITDKIIEWQSVDGTGAVIGGTPDDDYRVLLRTIMRLAGSLNRLPPILIPGIVRQGGNPGSIIQEVITGLKRLGWPKKKIRYEIRKITFSSSSMITDFENPDNEIIELVYRIDAANKN